MPLQGDDGDAGACRRRMAARRRRLLHGVLGDRRADAGDAPRGAPRRHRLGRLRRDLADKSEQLAALTARWEQEKSGLNRVGQLKKELDELRMQVDGMAEEAEESDPPWHATPGIPPMDLQ